MYLKVLCHRRDEADVHLNAAFYMLLRCDNQQNRPDVLHPHNFCSFHAILLYVYLRGARISPIIAPKIEKVEMDDLASGHVILRALAQGIVEHAIALTS